MKSPVFAGTAKHPSFQKPFHGTIGLERHTPAKAKGLRHKNFLVVPSGTLNSSRQYLKLSLRERSVPLYLLGVESRTICRQPR